jgi:5-methylcytosine-specific restriction endonuclease McrA
MGDISWEDSSAGAAKRVGHYLATEIGENKTFNKQDLRKVVPDTEQVDRRMRDLRKVGWIIRTYKDKASLKPNELFLEKIGDGVWKAGYKWPTEGLTSAKRRKVLDRDGRRCMVCGIDFGEEYPDRTGVVARPTIGHILPKERGGSDDLDNLRPECQFCNETARNLTDTPVDAELVKRRILELNRQDKQMLASWMLAKRRSFTDAERLWAQYSQLPLPVKEEVQRALSDALN